MTATIVMHLADRDGVAGWYEADPWSASGMRLTRYAATPVSSFVDSTTAVPVTVQHDNDAVIGWVHYLAVEHENLQGVAVLPDIPPDAVEGLYASTVTECRFQRGSTVFAEMTRLTAVGLVADTASLGTRPIRALDGDYRDSGFRWDRHSPAILRRAKAALRPEHRWRPPSSLVIHRPQPPERRVATTPETWERPSTRIEYRPGTILAVNGRPVRG